MSFEVAPPPDDAMRVFLTRVLPAGNKINVHWQSHWKDAQTGEARTAVPGEACDSVQSAVGWAKWADRKLNTDVWVCMSTQRMSNVKTGTTGDQRQRQAAVRSQENAVGLKALWLDVDVKAGGYASMPEALTAIAALLKATGFPRPTLLVESGYGIHLHWVLDRAISPAEWLPLGRALTVMAAQHGLLHDPQCSVDSVRLMRIPGLRNFKDPANPRPTKMNVQSVLPHDYPVDMLRGILTPWINSAPVAAATPGVAGSVVNLPARAPLAPGVSEYSAGVEDITKPVDLAQVVQQCGVLGDIRLREGNGDPEPLWNLALYAATFSDDPTAWAHDFSRGDPRYDTGTTDRKLQEKLDARARDPAKNGWSKCASFGLHKPSICAACQFNGKIVHPFQLGKPAIPASDDDLPTGYLRKDFAIFKRVLDEDGIAHDKLVFRYGVKGPRIERGPKGDTLLFTLEHSAKEVREVRLTLAAVSAGGRDFSTPLGEEGVVLNLPLAALAREFFVSWIQKLRESAPAKEPIPAFGWVEGEQKGFAVAGILYRADGTETVTSGSDTVLARGYAVKGTLAAWKLAADFITGQGRPQLEVLLAAAFAGPLVHYTGQTGLLVSGYSPESGVGKSSVMKVGQSVWGNPVDAMQGLNDTAASVSNKLGALRSVPVFWDELHNEEDTNKFVTLAFQLGQGKEKARLSSEIHQRAVGTWTTMLVCASNDSIMTAMERNSKGGAAGINRVFEVLVPPTPGTVQIANASQLIGKTHRNYGHAGIIYARWLAANQDKLEGMVQRTANTLSAAANAAPEERFWLFSMACMLVGATVARHLGLVDFNLPALKTYLLGNFAVLRGERVRSGSNIADPSNVLAIIERYLAELSGRHLLKTDHMHIGQGKPANNSVRVLNVNTGQLQGVEAHIAVADGVLRLKVGALSRWLDHNRIGRRVVLDTLRDTLQARQSRGRLGSGTPYTSTVNTQIIDLDLKQTALAGMAELQAAAE